MALSSSSIFRQLAAGGRGLAAIAHQVGTSPDSAIDFLAFARDNTKRDAPKSVSCVATKVVADRRTCCRG
jgi:hypothetical protein